MRQFNPKTSPRGRFHIPEFGQTRGPVELGQSEGLFTENWAFELQARSSTVTLYKLQGEEWMSHSNFILDSESGDLRHLSVTFDSSGWPVAAYETTVGIFIRQYNIGSQSYEFKGPFPGVDPVVFNDALILGPLGDTDVVLWHLDSERGTILSRLQRELYQLPHVEFSAEPTLFLDQIVPTGHRIYVLATRGIEPVYFSTQIYPLITKDAQTLTGNLNQGTYNLIRDTFTPQASDVATLTGEFQGTYLSIRDIILTNGPHDLSTFTGNIKAGTYSRIKDIFAVDSSDQMVTSGELSKGSYAIFRNVVLYNGLTEVVTMSGSIPGGKYVAI